MLFKFSFFSTKLNSVSVKPCVILVCIFFKNFINFLEREWGGEREEKGKKRKERKKERRKGRKEGRREERKKEGRKEERKKEGNSRMK